MTSPPHFPKKAKILLLPQKKKTKQKQKNKYAIKANIKIEYLELNKWFAPPCAFYISMYPLFLGRGLVTPYVL